MSILLDSNVVSELIKGARHPAVANWVAKLPLEDLFFSAMGEAELLYGVAILPKGRRRKTLLANITGMLRDAFGDRILPFDRAAAYEYADIAAVRRAIGRPVAPFDCQIAAIARSRGMAVATRNVRHFDDIGLDIIDPWTAA